MKLMHLSDLHLGKRVNGFSMLDDQRYILKQITDVVDAEQPDGVLIAGMYMINRYRRRRPCSCWMIFSGSWPVGGDRYS